MEASLWLKAEIFFWLFMSEYRVIIVLQINGEELPDNLSSLRSMF